MSNKRVHIFVKGRVQGVFFRAYTEQEAKKLALTGWVRNCPDASVEIMAEGPENSLEELVKWCYKGSLGSKVESVEKTFEDATGEFTEFKTIHFY